MERRHPSEGLLYEFRGEEIVPAFLSMMDDALVRRLSFYALSICERNGYFSAPVGACLRGWAEWGFPS